MFVLKCVKINLFPSGKCRQALNDNNHFSGWLGRKESERDPLLFSQFIRFQHFEPYVGSLYFSPERKTQKMNDICLCFPQEKVLVLSSSVFINVLLCQLIYLRFLKCLKKNCVTSHMYFFYLGLHLVFSANSNAIQ